MDGVLDSTLFSLSSSLGLGHDIVFLALAAPFQQQLVIDSRVSLPSGSPSDINTLERNLMLGATQHYR